MLRLLFLKVAGRSMVLTQPTMRWLSKIAKRKHVAVADVIYEAIESFLAKWEAEAELETKIIKFPTSLKR